MVETTSTARNDAPSSSSEHLTQLLHRQNHPERPLLALKDMSTHRSWDHSWPTLTESRRFTDRHTYGSDDSFRTVLQNHNHGLSYALLKAVGAVECRNVRGNHIVLYGGALVDIVLKRESSIADWDLRLIGPQFCDSEDLCVEVAQKFVKDVFLALAKENDRIAIINAQVANSGSGNRIVEESFDISEVTTSRIQSTVTIAVPGRRSPSLWDIRPTTLQLTFAPYSSVRDLFGNSLPHCTRIAILNDVVVLDELAHYCLESVCVILSPDDLCHTSVVRATKEEGQRETVSSLRDDDNIETVAAAPSLAYEVNRFIKYFHKGFDIIVPDLDMTAIPRRLLKFHQTEVLDLPYLTITFDKVDENKIMVDSLEIPETVLEATNRDSSGGTGRGGYGSLSPPAPVHPGSCVHHNIPCLIRGDFGQFHFVAEGERTESIFDYCPLLTSRMIGKAYEMVEGRLSSNIDVQLILDYFGAGVAPSEVLTQLVLDPIQSQQPRTFQIPKARLTELVTCEKEALLERIQELPQILKKQGRDKLVHRSRSSVSTVAQVRAALLGSYAKYE